MVGPAAELPRRRRSGGSSGLAWQPGLQPCNSRRRPRAEASRSSSAALNEAKAAESAQSGGKAVGGGSCPEEPLEREAVAPRARRGWAGSAGASRHSRPACKGPAAASWQPGLALGETGWRLTCPQGAEPLGGCRLRTADKRLSRSRFESESR